MKTMNQRAKLVMTLVMIISLGTSHIAFGNTTIKQDSVTKAGLLINKIQNKAGVKHLSARPARVLIDFSRVNATIDAKIALPKSLKSNTCSISPVKTILFTPESEFDQVKIQLDKHTVAFENTGSREKDDKTFWKGPGRYKKYNGKFLA
jgi:hypothetical protein